MIQLSRNSSSFEAFRARTRFFQQILTCIFKKKNIESSTFPPVNGCHNPCCHHDVCLILECSRVVISLFYHQQQQQHPGKLTAQSENGRLPFWGSILIFQGEIVSNKKKRSILCRAKCSTAATNDGPFVKSGTHTATVECSFLMDLLLSMGKNTMPKIQRSCFF